MREFTLLIWPSLILGAGCAYALLSPGQGVLWRPGYALTFLLIGFWGTHLVLQATGHRGDEYLLPLAFCLTAIGLTFIGRLDAHLAWRQVTWTAIAILALIVTVTAGRDYQRWLQYPYFYLTLGLFFLVLTVILGTRISGAKSWLTLGSFQMQPVEAVKILMVLFLANFLEIKRELLSARAGVAAWGPLLLAVALALLFLVIQRDLGSALIILTTFLAMLYVATQRLRFVLGGGLIFAFGVLAAYHLFPYLRVRFGVWLNPWPVAQAAGYQVVQGLFAFAGGGLLGTGLGLGQPEFIPAVATDFIFAAIGEELGLAGGLAIICLYILLAYRGYRAALRAPDGEGLLLAAGLTFLLTFQAFVIMAGVSKLLPLTGVTLPFVSYGGSSLVASYIALGLLLNVSAAGWNEQR
ncbi:MAG: hypothetical protein PWP65_1609 [Clostridia bacterium]|nr:hypothetical protein [Clostridia bacterium]